ncbi:arylsulfotransferase family protein [Spirillospora sp. NPDC052242]
MNGDPDAQRAFLFSPSSSYPRPLACLVDTEGNLVHAWSNPVGQPDPASAPPSYLRGWNHVELGADGSLYAMVPLHALLKLRPDSSLAWKVEIPVHHDLELRPGGEIYALTERPRLVPWNGGSQLVLDNLITFLSPEGDVIEEFSLYDLLTSHAGIRSLVDAEISRRTAASDSRTLSSLDALRGSTGREASRILRALPGSPCDVLHANTLEVLHTHPSALWKAGDVLVSLRELDIIAVVDLETQHVRWYWGPGELSAQHQPSALADGNLLVFDNGRTKQRSRVLELDPITKTIVWQYTADPPQAFFTPLAGGCERLPGGNVLITDAQAGRAIELTRDGRIIWTLQIHARRPTSTTSRCEVYRVAAVPSEVTARLSSNADDARNLAHALVQCGVSRTSLPARSSR